MNEALKENMCTRLLAEYDRKAAELNRLADQLRGLDVDMSDVQPDEWPVLPGMVNVLLQVDRADGNDPIEASVRLPFVPRVGDELEFWDKEGYHGGSPEFGTVKHVVQAIYWPERIVVGLTFEGFDMETVERVMENAQQDDQP